MAEIFTIVERLPRFPPVYRIKDEKEILEGVFYEEELQKVIDEDKLYKGIEGKNWSKITTRPPRFRNLKRKDYRDRIRK